MRILTAILGLMLLFAGCATDKDEGPSGPSPIDPTPPGAPPPDGSGQGYTELASVGRLHYGNDTFWPSASGIWPYGSYVFGSGLGAGFFVANISNPTDPRVLWGTPADSETPFSRDADVVAHADGRLTLVLATQSDGMHLYDVTDPAAPVFAARLLTDVPNHNVAVVPGTTMVFNSQSRGAGGTNELVDVADPFAPVVVGTYSDHGCHDITFHGSFGAEDFRAYCAAIQRTEIWDLTGLDVAAPQLGIKTVGLVELTKSPIVGNPVFGSSPARTLHHLAMPNADASILIIGDEFNGGGSPGACFLNDPLTGHSTPFGALWFYDISDEANPELLSWISPSLVLPRAPSNPTSPTGAVPNCTAHFGTLIPGEEKLVMGWYTAGVLLIDFSDPASPRILDQFLADGINTWDARVHGRYVYTGDIARGMDVLELR